MELIRVMLISNIVPNNIYDTDLAEEGNDHL